METSYLCGYDCLYGDLFPLLEDPAEEKIPGWALSYGHTQLWLFKQVFNMQEGLFSETP